MAWLQRGKCKCLCALHKADEPSFGRGGGYRQVLFHVKWLYIKLPSTGGGALWEGWLCQAFGDLPSACPSPFPRFLLKDSYYNHLKMSPKELLLFKVRLIWRESRNLWGVLWSLFCWGLFPCSRICVMLFKSLLAIWSSQTPLFILGEKKKKL